MLEGTVSRSKVIALGCLTAWSLLYLLMFLFLFDSRHFGAAFMAVHVVTMLVVLGLMGVYIIDLSRNSHVESDQRVPWTVAILLFGVFAMPVYWYQHIWSAHAGATAEPEER